MLKPISRRALGALALVACSLLVVTACDPITTPAAWQGPSYQGASGSPSGSKPESKVWFNDGVWWADLWDTASGDFYIHRLDLTNHQWVRTSTHLDTRSNSRADSLWDGTHLFVASHVFAEGSSKTATGYPAELRRFSYNPTDQTYALDPGFPVTINSARTETLVIDEDSQGRIWATWMQNRQIMVATSSVGGTSWSVPVALPVTGTLTSSDDVSSVMAFGGNRIGIMWSNQNDQKMYFTSRADADPIGAWGATETAYDGQDAADDHINLKTASDQNGRILAAVKTSKSGSAPLVHLLDRNPVTATWTSHVFGLASDNHTRPIVLVDRSAGVVHMFATSGQSGGAIYEKTAPLSNINFAPGKGTPVLSDPDNPDINNATSTKQTLDASTGLVILATNDTTRQYWTYYKPLGGSTAPAAPKASFTASPTSGPGPLAVSFTNTSTGNPTSSAWTFGDGTTSNQASPTHTYGTTGTYTVTLKVTNANGSNTMVRDSYVTVSDVPVPPAASFTASPTSGPGPLAVSFTNTSTGNPTSSAWTFGDGTTSNEASPTHTYSTTGSYTVTLKVTNASGSNTVARANYVTVGAAPTTQTFVATADALVKSSSPTRNYGTDTVIRTRSTDPTYNSYLRFDLAGLATPPRSAVLRLFVTDASKAPGTVASTSTAWDERAITWNNAPPANGAPLATAPASVIGTWLEFDVTAAVTGNGPVAFVLSSTSTDSAIEASRETTTPPQLVVTP